MFSVCGRLEGQSVKIPYRERVASDLSAIVGRCLLSRVTGLALGIRRLSVAESALFRLK